MESKEDSSFYRTNNHIRNWKIGVRTKLTNMLWGQRRPPILISEKIIKNQSMASMPCCHIQNKTNKLINEILLIFSSLLYKIDT